MRRRRPSKGPRTGICFAQHALPSHATEDASQHPDAVRPQSKKKHSQYSMWSGDQSNVFNRRSDVIWAVPLGNKKERQSIYHSRATLRWCTTARPDQLSACCPLQEVALCSNMRTFFLRLWCKHTDNIQSASGQDRTCTWSRHSYAPLPSGVLKLWDLARSTCLRYLSTCSRTKHVTRMYTTIVLTLNIWEVIKEKGVGSYILRPFLRI